MKSVKNVSRILSRKSFPDFLKAMNYKTDVKEWSEVGGVLNQAMSILKVFDASIILDIGCGKRPTLATLMALNFKKLVYAIDPQLDTSYSTEIDFLELEPIQLASFTRKNKHQLKNYNKALILCNHSHVSRKEIKLLLDKFDDWVYLTVPCCVDNKLTNLKSIHYKDIHMHTDKNDIHIYSKNENNLRKLMGD